MAYIGTRPTVGNFVKLDTITTSATTTFNLTNGGVAYYPQSPNHCLVSLNGILQAPTDSFTISGSTIIFSSALTTSDVIDFIIVLGDVLNIGTPSDNTVSLAKLTATGTKDATTFLRGDNTFSTPSSDFVLLATTDITSSTASVSFDGYYSATYKNYQLVFSNTVPVTDAANLYVRYRQSNADVTASSYKSISGGSQYGSGTEDDSQASGNAGTFIRLTVGSGVDNDASHGGVSGYIYIYNPLGTTYGKQITGQLTNNRGDGATWNRSEFGAVLTDTTALSGISLYFSSGNITSGNFKLYGIK